MLKVVSGANSVVENSREVLDVVGTLPVRVNGIRNGVFRDEAVEKQDAE